MTHYEAQTHCRYRGIVFIITINIFRSSETTKRRTVSITTVGHIPGLFPDLYPDPAYRDQFRTSTNINGHAVEYIGISHETPISLRNIGAHSPETLNDDGSRHTEDHSRLETLYYAARDTLHGYTQRSTTQHIHDTVESVKTQIDTYFEDTYTCPDDAEIRHALAQSGIQHGNLTHTTVPADGDPTSDADRARDVELARP